MLAGKPGPLAPACWPRRFHAPGLVSWEAAFTSEGRVRDVICNFNTDGFSSLYPKYKGGRPPRFTLAQRREIKKIAKSHPTCAGRRIDAGSDDSGSWCGGWLQELAQVAGCRGTGQASGHLIAEDLHLGLCVPGVGGKA